MGHTIPEMCRTAGSAPRGWHWCSCWSRGAPRPGSSVGPAVVLQRGWREAHGAPEVAPPALGASLHCAGGMCLDISVIPGPRDCAESPWACRAPTVPCSGKEGPSCQPSWSWFAPAPSHQYLTFASSYFAGTAHVTVMGMKCVPRPSSMAHFTPWPLTIRTPCPLLSLAAALGLCRASPAIVPCQPVSVLLAVV